jgi:predicted RNA-binding protein with EMAP domain
MAPVENAWHEYSKLVLEQLESLSTSIEALRFEMQEMRQELAVLKAKEDKVVELKMWKEKVDEVVSPSQMKILTEDVQDLKEFRTRAITIFLVAQAVIGFVLAYTHLLIP